MEPKAPHRPTEEKEKPRPNGRVKSQVRPKTENAPKPIVRVGRHLKDNMEALRLKFIHQAKKYLGIPYRKKYFNPEDPLFNSPLFLDCCGLVRKCLQDLREDFGFKIGPWNQSYQFDTLPVTVPLERMKPGDLIFYEAKFYDTTKKKIHNMTHVEIFLGGTTGEQTIGARFRTGVVSIFDSYKFESKNWYDPIFHYKSIDTWLKGVCLSFCQKHPWKIYKKKKKAITAPEAPRDGQRQPEEKKNNEQLQENEPEEEPSSPDLNRSIEVRRSVKVPGFKLPPINPQHIQKETIKVN